MTPIIHLGFDPATYPAGAAETVRDAAPGYELLVTTDREEVERELERIEVALDRFPRDLLPRSTALRWYQQADAGADWIRRREEVASLPFTLTNASGVHAIPMSEHMMGMLLALTRNFHVAVRAQQERIWHEIRRRDLPELAGMRVLVLGVGAIGERFARLCRAFQMEVVGVRRDPARTSDAVDRMIGPEALRDELPHADVVASTLPLTEETYHVIGREELAIIKRGAFIINVGRGATIDEQALVEALRSGAIAGAGLDVFETEPLPDDSPLWELQNVVLTPHYSGLTPNYNARVFDIFLDNLGRYLRGEALRNVVDKSLGY